MNKDLWKGLLTMCVFCSTLLAFGTGGSKTPTAFIMELSVPKISDWKLLLIYKKFHIICGMHPRSESEKQR